MTEQARIPRSVNEGLATGKRKVEQSQRPVSLGGLAALQRAAGNEAVTALLAGKLRASDESASGHMDAALEEMRTGDPALDTVEKGLKAAKAVGVPVELEGPKPPASALAVTMTGFGPAAVAPKKPVPPVKPVPKISPLGKAAAKPAKKAPANAGRGGRAASPAVSSGAKASGPAALSADQLLQPPVSPESVAPEQDPAFTQVAGSVGAFAKDKRAHPTASSKAKEAQDAALAPTDDLAGQAKAAKVDTMDAQPAGSFDKKAFIAAVKTAIEAKSPKTLVEADAYAESGKAGEVKGEVKGLVAEGEQGQEKDIKAATDAAPDTSVGVPKPVIPMAQEQQSPAASIPASGAAPKPAPPEQVNLEAGKHQANSELAGADVDEKQLAESNEPEFQQALVAKDEAAAHADAAPAQYRKDEQQTLTTAKADAATETKAGVTGMQGSKAAALAAVVADKGKTKTKDEAKRAEVTTRVQGIFATTETDVKKILDGIDPLVEKAFDAGEAGARKSFEGYVGAKMAAYKKDRYSGWLGGLRWAKDKLVGMPDKVNEFYVAGRELYLKQMDVVISNVADIVGNELGAAKKRIAAGKTEIADYVKSLPANLQKVGAEASKEIADKFDSLEDDVKSKQDAVVDTLATKYTEARKGLDDRIDELQAENKGLVDKAIGAIKAVINTIRQLAAMLMNTLARVASVVGDIVKHPVKFLTNLIDGVKGGILKFKDNILDHLRKGLMTWLFGALAEGGIELPDKFDLPGVVKLLASLFGLTWRNIRNRLVKQIGEKAMGAIEKGVEIFQVLSTAGVAGLWQMLVDKLGDIKEMILEQAKEFVVTRIITAGITWLIGLLNPAAAFIKACKLIYDIIMFFVNNAERILKFVNTVIDSAVDIVRGNIGGVVAKIEDVLGQMVPILIGFLASVIGIGGIGQKIREIVGKLQKPVTKAIDFVIKQGLKLAGPIIRGLKGIGGKVKAKVAAGKAWVKGKAEAGKKWVKKKADGSRRLTNEKPEAGHKNAGGGQTNVTGRPAEGAVVGTAATNAGGHAYEGKAVVHRGSLHLVVQRAVVDARTAAQISSANATRNGQLPLREQLNRLIRSIAGLEAQGIPTNPEQVQRINRLLTTIVQQELAAAANAASITPTGSLSQHIVEFKKLTGVGERRWAYYMAMVPWGTVTNAIRARDVSRIVDQVRKYGTEWVSGDSTLEVFRDSLFDDIALGSEGPSDERIPGMPKYVPRAAFDSFIQGARELRARERGGRNVSIDTKARQAIVDSLLNGIRTGSFGVDHRGSLAQHWNSTGYKCTADVRARFASDPANLVLVSFNWNSSKGGEGANYNAEPADGFTRARGEIPAPPGATSGPAAVPQGGIVAQ